MAKRTVVHVTPNKRDGGWDVQKAGAGPKQHFDTKDPAVDHGRAVAKSAELGQLKIHKENGRLQTEYTYGKDPERHKG